MNKTIVYTSPMYQNIQWLTDKEPLIVPSRVKDFTDILPAHIKYPLPSVLQIGRKMFYADHCALFVSSKIDFSHSVIFNAFALIVSPDNQKKLNGYFYKAEPNGTSKTNGDFFCFCEPNMVIAELDKLINYITKNPNLSIIEQAAIIFYSILKIHPFEDNNGKTARLLCDMVLLRGGQQPAFNTSFDRMLYKQSIDTADEGSYTEVTKYIQNQQLLSRSNAQ